MIGETIARRSESSSGLLVSTLVHGAVALAAVLLIGHDIAAPPAPKVELVDISPAMQPATVSATASPPGKLKGTPAASQGHAGRRGHTVSPIDIPNVDPYATLTASVDHGPAIGPGTGSHGLGAGKGIFGHGLDGMPGGNVGDDAQYMGVPSLQRDPSPRDDYSTASGFLVSERLAGKTVVVDLELDREGNVTSETIAKGSGDDDVDRKIAAAIGRFKFFPALDAEGKPVASKYRWLWLMQPPWCAEDFSTVAKGGVHPCVRAK